MRRITSTIPALAVGLVLSAADSKDDIERLQGTWVMVSLEMDGEQRPRDEVATARVVIEGNRYLRQVGGEIYPESFTLDPDQTPKAIDFTYTEGPRQRETIKGIYKLEGDRWMICRALLPGDERPKEFATRADSRRVLGIWKRDRPSEDARR